MPPYATSSSQFGAAPMAYAGFWQRFGANLLDGLLLTLVMVPLLGPGLYLVVRAFDDCDKIAFVRGEVVTTCGPGQLQGGLLAAGIALIAVGVILAVAWYCRRLGRGQTPGQKVVGIAVVDANHGGPIGTGRAVGRFFARYLSGMPCYLGYLWMLWDQRKQTFHDKIVGSVVIRQ